MKVSILGHVVSAILILLLIVLTQVHIWMNFFIFYAHFQDYESLDVQRHTLLNKMGEETFVYVKNWGLNDNAIYFNCLGQHRADLAKIYNTKLQDSNFMFLLHRGHENNQFFRNKKLILSDIEAVADFIMNKTDKNATITVTGHSLGCWSALRCAEFIFSKNRECKIKIVDPFFSIYSHLSYSIPMVQFLLTDDFSNERGFRKYPKKILVFFAGFETVLPAEETKKIKKLVKDLKIKNCTLYYRAHTDTMFTHDDFFSL